MTARKEEARKRGTAAAGKTRRAPRRPPLATNARATHSPGLVRLDARVVLDGRARIATPAPVLRQIAPVLDLLDGRPVAAVLAASPLPAALTLRILDRLVAGGEARLDVAATPQPVMPLAMADDVSAAISPPPSPTAPAPGRLLPLRSAASGSIERKGQPADGSRSGSWRLPLDSAHGALAVALAPSVLVEEPVPAPEPQPAAEALDLQVAQVVVVQPSPDPAPVPIAAQTPAAGTPVPQARASQDAASDLLPPPQNQWAFPIAAVAPQLFSTLEESFFASEAPEFREARELATLGDLSSLSGAFRRPPPRHKRSFSLASALASARAWLR